VPTLQPSRLSLRRWVLVLGAPVLIVSTVLFSAIDRGTRVRADTSTADSRVGLLRQQAQGLGAFKHGPIATASWRRDVGVDPDSARKATIPDSRWLVWLAANGSRACLFYALPESLSASAACGLAEDVGVGRMSVTHVGGGANPIVTIIGIVPDGVSEVVVADAGAQRSFAVHDNAFAATVDDRATEYRFTSPDGPQVVRLVMAK
jgi:hypothetical protein